MGMQGAKQTNLIAQRTADHLHPHTGREPGIMLPAPRQKLPEISPIFKADTVRLHVSREKDKEIALIYRCWMGRYEGRSAGRLRPSSRGV